jgi:hypothetical protein
MSNVKRRDGPLGRLIERFEDTISIKEISINMQGRGARARPIEVFEDTISNKEVSLNT